MTHIIPDPASESGDLSSLQIEDFWDRHGKSVVIAVVIVILAALGAVGVMIYQHNQEVAASTIFAEAKNEAQLQEVITKYPDSASAVDAALMLASVQRTAGKYDAATATLEALLKRSPDSRLAGLASLGLASNYAAAGQGQKYLEALQQTATKYNNSFVAPYALLGQAEYFMAQGKNSDAIPVLRSLTEQYPESIFSRPAGGYLERLDSVSDTDTKN
ncbi:MAG: tetratricopeptide repeat protein [Chthoniobacterales bacterium]